MNLEVFFDSVRASVFDGGMSRPQVAGMNVLLSVWQEDYSANDPRWLAYCLGTTFHETAATMQPIEEYGSDARANRLYGIEGNNPKRARRMGNTKRGDGARYKGRGFVQLTWKNNYRRAGRVFGVDLVKDPDRAMEPELAAHVLYQGCIEGWFTTQTLADHIHGDTTDYFHARKIVNGMNKARLIAGYADKFEAAIVAAIEAPPAPPDIPKPSPSNPAPKKRGFMDLLVELFTKLIRRK